MPNKHREYTSKTLEFFEKKKKDIIFRPDLQWKKSETGQEIKQTTIASNQSHSSPLHLILVNSKAGSHSNKGRGTYFTCSKNNVWYFVRWKKFKQDKWNPLNKQYYKRIMYELSDCVQKSMISTLKQIDYYSLNIYESTYVAEQVNLLAFVRFAFNNSVEKKYCFRVLVYKNYGRGNYLIYWQFF